MTNQNSKVQSGSNMPNNLMVFTGNANPDLALKVAKWLGVPLGRAEVHKFSDGEINVELNENVRGQDVFIIQPTCSPTNDNLMELLLMADALHRSSANRITAVVPYFGYARQDRRVRSARVPISAKVVADMLVAAGVNRVLTIDLHAEQIQGFFSIPVDNGSAGGRCAQPELRKPDYGIARHRRRGSRPRLRQATCYRSCDYRQAPHQGQ